MTDLREQVARAICAEKCAFKGEPPCWSVEGDWPNPHCDEPGCHAEADAALSVVEGQRGYPLEALRKQVLVALSKDGWADPIYRTIAQISDGCGIPNEVTRAILRNLTDDGLAQYASGLFNEDGQVWGSGYAITESGLSALDPHVIPMEGE